MRPRLLLKISLVSLLLVGCSTTSNYAMKSDTTDPQSSGIVVGSIASDGAFGTAISVTNVNAHKETIYRGATTYSLTLPEGNYTLSGVGSSVGLTAPVGSPLTFSVKKGYINYVGHIDDGCATTLDNMTEYGVKYCGLLALSSNCTVSKSQTLELCTSDKRESSVATFLQQHPEYKALPVQSSIMRPQ